MSEVVRKVVEEEVEKMQRKTILLVVDTKLKGIISPGNWRTVTSKSIYATSIIGSCKIGAGSRNILQECLGESSKSSHNSQ